ncbi:MAG TPA: adenylate/guanylate cyclase domain-containing protein, partial [Ruania sp.]|nr:adenylate/guanylate cyclase domain-containing protein [Ruania sp.]
MNAQPGPNPPPVDGERPSAAQAAPSGSANSATVNRHHERLLGGPPELTVAELAARAGVEEQITRQYWRSLGFPDVPEDQKHFTETDVAALRDLAEAVKADTVSLTAAQDLVRGLGHSMDRLVLWQVETMVQDVSARYRLDDVSARLVVLDRMVELSPLLREQLDYAWRRQLFALLGRIDRDISRVGLEGSEPDQLPLERAIGFIDIVS